MWSRARGLTGGLVERGEHRAREHVGVADELVHDVGLGCVERHRVMAHVLRRQEPPFGERAVERAGRHQARNRFEPEAGEPLQPAGDLPELRDPIGRQREAVGRGEVLGAGVLLVLDAQLARDERPQRVLFRHVRHRRDRLAGHVGGGDRGDRGPPGQVVLVGAARMVERQVEALGFGFGARRARPDGSPIHPSTIPSEAAVRTGSSR